MPNAVTAVPKPLEALKKHASANLSSKPHRAELIRSATPLHLSLDRSVQHAAEQLCSLQLAEGCWSFELEADCTIPAEYIIMMHYMGKVDEILEAKIAHYLRSHQNKQGGWPLFLEGEAELSCSVKVYFALKLAGDKPKLSHMQKASKAILSMGGAAATNVFTRITLALFQQIPWRGVPFIPVETMFFPAWFPFHLLKVSYWSRTVMVPLFILCSMKPKAKNPKKVDINELFYVAPELERNYFPARSRLNRVLFGLDQIARTVEPLIPKMVRQLALKKAEKWILRRLNGKGGLGAIFPAMVNAYEALDCLGYATDHPALLTAKQAIDELLVVKHNIAYCQPCNSPVWDTALAAHALLEAGQSTKAIEAGLNWLQQKQLSDEPGDWRHNKPDLAGGGWPFQFENSHYPDLDDTAAVVWAMINADQQLFQKSPLYSKSIEAAAIWTAGMQSVNGGFGSFDADNSYGYLNEIPFADHGALLDPPTADVSARCLLFLARTPQGEIRFKKQLAACLEYLYTQQEADGSWFGRWGTNYIYGTWSVLTALDALGIDKSDMRIRRAVKWLKDHQNSEGGWGESNISYHQSPGSGASAPSTAFQTAWALLALMAAGEATSKAVKKGITFLLEQQQSDGLWQDNTFTSPGFPRVFYLKYHGYQLYFPLWAIARYRNLMQQSNKLSPFLEEQEPVKQVIVG